ncbi:hypothetical protein [Pseudonocardia humida]|uniref:Uncharacterized protein n=1 Tax=Pseudonocardia humida TaxID=2800819 RepID=A0ABT1ADE2_9PSEU|nr:hypothetical protein [Pseudonocardia humida]MCO1661090.1 hypothetical protein [Pseudonocardia humida]
MIVLIIAGIAAIVVVAIAVGIFDAIQAASWREVAAERREKWEERVHELHGGFEAADPDWDDD